MRVDRQRVFCLSWSQTNQRTSGTRSFTGQQAIVESHETRLSHKLIRSSGARISPSSPAPELSTTPFPPVARTISLAPAIQLRLRWLALDDVPGSSCFVMPRYTISNTTPARCKVCASPRLRGNGNRGERDGSRVISVGEKRDGGDKDKAT